MKSIITLISAAFFIQCSAQQISADSVIIRRNQLNKNNAIILASWAGANIVQGSLAATNSKGSNKYFWNMNAYFNAVNLAVSGYGLYAVKKEMTRKLSDSENYRKQNTIEKILLLNTGLDAAYIMGGLYLNERGKRLANEKTEGYGSSLILQGGFLLVFDLIQYFEHRNNGKNLQKFNFQFTPTGVGIAYLL